MTRKKFMIIIIVLLVVFGAGGIILYNQLDSDFTQVGRQIESEDGHYAVSVPMTWQTTKVSSQYGVLAAQSKDGSMYMQLSLDPNTDEESSLKKYVNNYIQSIGQKSDNSEEQTVVVSPDLKKINGRSGYYFEISSTAGGVDVYLWCFCYETKAGIVHIDVSSPKNDAGTNAGVAQGIIDSISEQ
ncbi:MAG: hypothetical protein SOV71_03455 [Anaerovoracaceae bacterium]|nr:hypothetical protein [Bacillota bacterium]MDY2670593.1 hypothetical protein [Anaerovoracaceae bacterium]